MQNTLATNESKAIIQEEPEELPAYEVYMFDINRPIIMNEEEYQAVMNAFTAGNIYLKLNKSLIRLDSIKLIQPRINRSITIRK